MPLHVMLRHRPAREVLAAIRQLAALLMLATAAATVLVVRRVARWRTRRLLAAQVVPDGVDWSAVEQRVMQWPDHEDDTDCWCVRCYRAEIGRLAARTRWGRR